MDGHTRINEPLKLRSLVLRQQKNNDNDNLYSNFNKHQLGHLGFLLSSTMGMVKSSKV